MTDFRPVGTSSTGLLAPIADPAAMPLDRARAVERLRLTVVGLGLALLGLPVALVLGVAWLVALPLSLTLVGLPVLLGAVPTARALADVHRRVSGDLLGGRVPSAYAETRGRSLAGRLWTWVRDPARWRDFAFV